MKKIFSVTLLMSTMALSSTAFAHNYSEWYGKEGQDEKSTYMDHALSKLPSQEASDFRQTMKEAQQNNKDYQEQLYRLHGELHTILTAPNFDQDAFVAKRKEIQQVHDNMEMNRTEAFASAVSQLSQKDRMTLTRSLDHDHMKQHHHSSTQAHDSHFNADDSKTVVQH